MALREHFGTLNPQLLRGLFAIVLATVGGDTV